MRGPGVILREAGKPIVVMSFEFEDGRISGMRLVANPDRFRHVAALAP